MPDIKDKYNFILVRCALGANNQPICWDYNGDVVAEDGMMYINKINNASAFFKKNKDRVTKDGNFMFKLWSDGSTRVVNMPNIKFPDMPNMPEPEVETEPEVVDENSVKYKVTNSIGLKPDNLIISPVKWKYLVRTVLRGKNLMMTGPAGCGKTLSVTSVAKAMNRPFFYFNLGATQDPRSTLIGNTHFNKESGTYFAESTFVHAIRTPNSVILLDELSRAHPEAWNILMTVLDETQRYMRLDESPESPVVGVADGVSFLATANIGMEYTSTRTIDRAISDRFQILEMDILSHDDQVKLIKLTHPEISTATADILAKIYWAVQQEILSGAGKISTTLSTRTILSTAGLIVDGFKLIEAAEVSIYPYFSADGDAESERTYIKQLIQKFLPDDKFGNDNMFSPNEAKR